MEVSKESEEPLSAGQDLLEKEEFDDSFGLQFLYPKPLLIDNRGFPEPSILKHRRRKSEGSAPSFGVKFLWDESHSVGSRVASSSDCEDSGSDCDIGVPHGFSTFDTYD